MFARQMWHSIAREQEAGDDSWDRHWPAEAMVADGRGEDGLPGETLCEDMRHYVWRRV